MALGSLRVTVGRWTTKEDITYFLEQLKLKVNQLKVKYYARTHHPIFKRKRRVYFRRGDQPAAEDVAGRHLEAYAGIARPGL